MPELPEVEYAVQQLRVALVGRTIARVRPLHRVHATRLAPRVRRALVGARIVRVDRRGKHQLIHLADGRVIHVHFRMAGDWAVDPPDPLPRSARLVIELADGSRLVLLDPRALGTVEVHAANAIPELGLGPDAADPDLDVVELRMALARRRGPIKPALLDQRLLAGVGNIYAAEGLWHARMAPDRPAASLTRAEVARLLRGIRAAMRVATGTRYAEGERRFEVYGRSGQPCARCGAAIARMTQAGRSTYYCPRCQAMPDEVAAPRTRPAAAPTARAGRMTARSASRAPRRARP